MSFPAGAAFDPRLIAPCERCTTTVATFDSLAASDSLTVQAGPAWGLVRVGRQAAGGSRCDGRSN